MDEKFPQRTERERRDQQDRRNAWADDCLIRCIEIERWEDRINEFGKCITRNYRELFARTKQ